MSTEKNFGVPHTGYTPMESAKMKAMMFANMGSRNRNRSLILRIAIICLALVIFVTPSIIIGYLGIFSIIYESNSLFTNIGMIVLVIPFTILLLALGLRIIYLNIKK